jgi:hypothetical protein
MSFSTAGAVRALLRADSDLSTAAPQQGTLYFSFGRENGTIDIIACLRSDRPRRRDDRQAQPADGAEPAPLALHRTGASQPTAAEMGLMPLEGLVDEDPAAKDGPIGEVAHAAAQQCRLWQLPVNPRDGCDLCLRETAPDRLTILAQHFRRSSRIQQLAVFRRGMRPAQIRTQTGQDLTQSPAGAPRASHRRPITAESVSTIRRSTTREMM